MLILTERSRADGSAMPASAEPLAEASGGSPAAITVPGLDALWAETLGDAGICVAVLDGPVDRTHASLIGARLSHDTLFAGGSLKNDAACRHGTHIASVIFGQHSGAIKGIAPHCRGVSIPIFESVEADSLRPCSQLDLARAIGRAVQQGAHIINISGGQFSPSGTAYPLLENVVRECGRRGILIVAAAGNEGCACLHVPAALPAVLAVGAIDQAGRPLAFSNWGGPYQAGGIVAPGENILGARCGGGTTLGTGTSYATAVVCGVAALLLSLQRQWGRPVDAQLVRAALLRSAVGGDDPRLLAGRLNVGGAVSLLYQGKLAMSDNKSRCNRLQPAAEAGIGRGNVGVRGSAAAGARGRASCRQRCATRGVRLHGGRADAAGLRPRSTRLRPGRRGARPLIRWPKKSPGTAVPAPPSARSRSTQPGCWPISPTIPGTPRRSSGRSTWTAHPFMRCGRAARLRPRPMPNCGNS